MKVAFVAEGDANTADCWSGSGQSFVRALRKGGVEVDVYDAELGSWSRAFSAGITYHPRRDRWRQRYLLGSVPFAVRSARVTRAIIAADSNYDAVIQIGATFAVRRDARRALPYVLYCDSNLAYARRGGPFSAANRLGPRELEGALKRERSIYDSATRIWTMSDALSASFESDFAQPRQKMMAIYAGANNPPAALTTKRDGMRILFVGRDHHRKGSALLLQAFRNVREVLPGAELHLVGGTPPDAGQPGVTVHGVLSRATAAGSRKLDELFGSATLFCMPSRYEPFGIAFVEAMAAGLPCVGTAGWAMPEIIADGITGWLVPDGSVSELTRVLIEALSDPAECARRGNAGRQRSLTRFTWERVAARAIGDLSALVNRPGTVLEPATV